MGNFLKIIFLLWTFGFVIESTIVHAQLDYPLNSSVSIHSDHACRSDCHNQGDCIAGTCYCYLDYSGADCSQNSKTVGSRHRDEILYSLFALQALLKPGENFGGKIERKQWRYFAVNVLRDSPGPLHISLLSVGKVAYSTATGGLGAQAIDNTTSCQY